ncbi:MAG: outer membrane protein transport protein [Sulfurimonas sp.]|jgi:long-chain fatty acid transport protein
MKKTIKLAVVAALALGATSAFATNGSNMIATGAKATGMGGVGIGMSHGAESALVNPALITSVEGTEISFGGTLFMPKVENINDLTGIGSTNTSSVSEAKINVIPEVSLASKINENFYMGVGMWGTAGMGVDYRDAVATSQMNMVTNLQLMQFGVPLAYKMNNFSAAITPILQYGSLDINYDATAMGMGKIGSGVAQSLKFGYNLGIAYEIASVTLGATYKSQIDMEYNGVLANAMNPMVSGLSGGANSYTNDSLSTPAEMGVGISYKFNANTIAFDFKQIKWSAAKGYQDFEWEDQNVFAVGYQYSAKTWAARLGYNYSKSPISEQTYTGFNSAGLGSGLANTFNLLGFPGVVQSHMTVGGSYNLSDKASVDLAYVYTPEVSNTYTNFLGADITTKHSQTALSAQLNYKF